MSRPVVIVGGGGHAGVVTELLKLSGCQVLGIVDPAMSEAGARCYGIPVLGGDEALETYDRQAVQLANGIGSSKSTAVRATVYRRFKESGFQFVTLIHPKATVSPGAQLGEGCQVMAAAVVQNGTRLGNNVLLNTCASVDHDCRIGANVHIAPRAVLSGGVVVEDDAHVGVGAVVIQGVTIGRGSHVGAGAVVTEDLPARSRIRAPKMLMGASA